MSLRQTIIVVSDGKQVPAATQKISFGQPFSTENGQSDFDIKYVDETGRPTQIIPALHSDPVAVILSRMTRERGLQWIEFAHANSIPAIFHIDDDLLSVPETLGKVKFEAYNHPDRLRALRNNIERCDLVYVSTSALKDRFTSHGILSPIKAGDIYCSIDPNEVGGTGGPATGPVIGYMGTGGHSEDLAMILPAICELLDHIPDLHFELFGTIEMPDDFRKYGSRVRHLPPVADYNQFIPFLRSLGWWIGLAPLEDNEFNRCKADTKWVEYTLSGMATIASDLPVYHRACQDNCGLLAKNAEDWRNAIQDLLFNPARRNSLVQAAQTKLREQYSHAALRSQVLDIIALARQTAITKGTIQSP